jgi:hypothetical protein
VSPDKGFILYFVSRQRQDVEGSVVEVSEAKNLIVSINQKIEILPPPEAGSE